MRCLANAVADNDNAVAVAAANANANANANAAAAANAVATETPKDPGRAIPAGTLWAVVTMVLVYGLIIVLQVRCTKAPTHQGTAFALCFSAALPLGLCGLRQCLSLRSAGCGLRALRAPVELRDAAGDLWVVVRHCLSAVLPLELFDLRQCLGLPSSYLSVCLSVCHRLLPADREHQGTVFLP
eukprot:SAG22_NODE_152_length_17377_cov_191.856928_14_plen_184_part_00